MRYLICGSRSFDDAARFESEISGFDITEVVEGEARGADTLAREWAERNNIPVLKFPADWTKYGKAAGPIRNKQMLDEGRPEGVIAFLASGSRGTANMITQAHRAGLSVHVVDV